MSYILDPRYQLDPRGMDPQRRPSQDPDYPNSRLVLAQMQVTGLIRGVTVYNINYPCGSSPEVEMEALAVVRRGFVMFGAAETGGNASNSTDVEFRVGDGTTYTSLGTVNTYSTKGSAVGALEVLELSCHEPLPRAGVPLYVRLTRNGTGKDYDNNLVQFGFDILLHRDRE